MNHDHAPAAYDGTSQPSAAAEAWPPSSALLRDVGYGLSETVPIYAGYYLNEEPEGPFYEVHYAIELVVVLSGRLTRFYPSGQMELRAGEACYCGVFEPHGWQITRTPCEQLVLDMLPEALILPETQVHEHHDLLAPFCVPANERPVAVGEKRRQLLRSARFLAAKLDRPGQALWRSLMAVELLSILQRGWSAPSSRARAPSYGLRDAVSKAIKMALASRRPVSVEEAARTCALSGREFSSAFRAVTGLSFRKFGLRHRVSGAAGQLRCTTDPEKKIARDWGFTDVSHLHRCFARHYGCNPGEYRRGARDRRAPTIPTPELWSALWDLPGITF